jgi:hypothetical protein
MRLGDFAHLPAREDFDALQSLGVWETHIEVKRYRRFSLHTIFEGKFGR